MTMLTFSKWCLFFSTFVFFFFMNLFTLESFVFFYFLLHRWTGFKSLAMHFWIVGFPLPHPLCLPCAFNFPFIIK